MGRRGRFDDLLVTEIACLAGGRWAATRTGLVMLMERGLLRTDMRGRIERRGGSARTGEPLEQALFAALLGSSGAREMAEKPRVRRTLVDVRRGLVRRALVRRWWVRALFTPALAVLPGVVVARLVAQDVVTPTAGVWVVVAGAAAACLFLPRRTLAGARTLRRLRSAHADLAAEIQEGAAQLPPERLGLAVALFGDAALLGTMPAVARGAGFLDGGRWTRIIHHGNSPYSQWTGAAGSEMSGDNSSSPS